MAALLKICLGVGIGPLSKILAVKREAESVLEVLFHHDPCYKSQLVPTNRPQRISIWLKVAKGSFFSPVIRPKGSSESSLGK